MNNSSIKLTFAISFFMDHRIYSVVAWLYAWFSVADCIRAALRYTQLIKKQQ
jgi:hypothetical protein